MKKYLLTFLVIGGALTLAGCKTAEVKKDPEVDSLTLNAENQKKSETPAQNQKQAVSPQVKPQSLNSKKMYASQPAMSIDTKKNYTATLKTSAGNITIELQAKETPITVNNFVFLSREKFYDQVIFHRTIPNFMIQGGDPTGTGMGDPGYKFDDEPFQGEYERGTVAMANAGPDTNGSQFFIMHGNVELPKNYVIFGKVSEGMDVVDKIATAPTKPGGEGSTPVNPVVIESVEITEK